MAQSSGSFHQSDRCTEARDDGPPPRHRLDHGGAGGGRLVRPARRRRRPMPSCGAILAHNRDEEKEHAAMTLEWLRRHDAVGTSNCATTCSPTSRSSRSRRARQPASAKSERGRRLARHRQPARERSVNHAAARARAVRREALGAHRGRSQAHAEGTLAARKLVDFAGPLGWEASAVDDGRVARVEAAPLQGAEARLRKVQPLVELRVPLRAFRATSWKRPAAARKDPELEPVREAARHCGRLARTSAVFRGFAAAGIRGIAEAAAAARSC